jgi:uncharacterized protein
VIEVAVHLGVFLAWNLGIGLLLLYVGPPLGLAGALALSALLLWGYLLRGPAGTSATRRWAALRLRPLSGEVLGWTLAAIPVVLLLSWSVGDLYTRAVPVPVESLNPFEAILATREGRLSIAVFAIAVAPIVEEFVFRGLIQWKLERRLGAVAGILAAAALFALVHALPWVLPLHLFLGTVFGFAVYATRSIWTGVILHAANNTVALVGVVVEGGEPPPTGTLWQAGVTADLLGSGAALLFSVAAAFWVARKLWEAGRPARLRSA